MALARWKPQELRELGESLRAASAKILAVVEKMELAKFDDLVLQATAAVTTYAPSIAYLAGTIESEFTDQHNAAASGRIARWQVNQKKVEARAEKRRIAEERRAAVKKSPAAKPKKRTKAAK